MTIRKFLLVGAASASLIAPAAWAQEATDTAAAAAPDTEADAGTGQIVVTARRRAEELQDVPLAVTVLNAQTIEQTGSYNINRLQQLQPSLQFFSTNPRNSSLNIRGLGVPLGLTNDGIEQGVGIYVDQVFYNRVAAAALDFVDIEQIEVLRGPQGTLYGKNTTAGAINITTRAPSFSYEGKAEISVGNLNFKQAKATVSGPITDRLAIRIGASLTDRQGTIYNVATNQHVNSQDFLGLRGALLWKATDTLSITLAGDYNLQNPNCCAQIYAGYGPTQRPVGRQYPALAALFPGYAVPSTNPYDRLTDLDAQLKARNELGGASLRAEWEVGAGKLTSVTAYRYWDWQPSNDRDFTGLSITPISQNPTQQKQWTQELRYAQTGDTIDFVAGAFGFYQKIHTTGQQVQGADASRWFFTGDSTYGSLASDPSVLDGLTADNDIRLKNWSAALFGQATWHVTDKLDLQPGIRLNYDKKDGSYDSVVTTGTGQLLTFADTSLRARAQRSVLSPQYFQETFSDWNLSYDFTASYHFADTVMGYATYSRGFKSGGLNLNGVPLSSTGVPQTDVATVKPEKVNHFELGLKTQFFDRKATFNLTGFWTEISDYQAIVNNGQNSVLRGYLANADKVRTRGIEWEFNARPHEQISLYYSGAYTDATYRKFENAPCPQERAGGTTATAANPESAAGRPGIPGSPSYSPLTCDISGQILPGISKWAMSYGVEFNVPTALLGGEGQFYIGWDGNYRSKFSSNASRSVYMDIKGYTLNNLRIGFRNRDGLNVYGWVRNIFDKDYMELLATTPSNTGLIAGQPGDPRTYGLTIKANF
ncbi:MAG: TonB-dependent receptor [Sphingobium sp.]|nr:MAG: TonB-dependent receptor [Sphingobium sp.]